MGGCRPQAQVPARNRSGSGFLSSLSDVKAFCRSLPFLLQWNLHPCACVCVKRGRGQQDETPQEGGEGERSLGEKQIQPRKGPQDSSRISRGLANRP